MGAHTRYNESIRSLFFPFGTDRSVTSMTVELVKLNLKRLPAPSRLFQAALAPLESKANFR
jgi:hypothetical protein